MKRHIFIYLMFFVSIAAGFSGCEDMSDEFEKASSNGHITRIEGLVLDGQADEGYASVDSRYTDSISDARDGSAGMDIEYYCLARDDRYLWVYISFHDGFSTVPGDGSTAYSCYYSGYFNSSTGDYLLSVDYDSGWSASFRNVLQDSSTGQSVDVTADEGLEMRIPLSAVSFDIFEFDFSSYNYSDSTAIRKYWF